MTPADELAAAVASLANIALEREGRTDLLALLDAPDTVKVMDGDDADAVTLTI